MYLQQVKFIDVNRSEWNKETSKPNEGIYDFTKKAFVNNDKKESRTDWHFEWVPWNKNTNYREFSEYKTRYGADFVKAGVDPFIPDGVPPDGDGHYLFMNDVVLIKYPLLTWLRKQDEASKMSMRVGRDRLKSFNENMAAQGAGLPDGFAEEFAEKTFEKK